MGRTPPKRNPENTSLTISLPKTLKERIEVAAKDDRRAVSPWCVIELEKVLDRIEREKAPVQLKVAETPDAGPSHSIRAAGAPAVKYPQGRRRKK